MSFQKSQIVKFLKHDLTWLYSASLVAQTVKRLPTMRETQVPSLGQEDPLEKEMVTHCSTLAWKIPWTEEPGRLQSMGSQRVRHDWAILLSLSPDYNVEYLEMDFPSHKLMMYFY